jgi:hypothetical protein
VVTSYSLIPHRAALCKNVVTRQAIQNYGLGEFPVYPPLGTNKLPHAWSYVKPTNKPNQEKAGNGNGNKFRGPVYINALLEAIQNVNEDLSVPAWFPWEHPTSRCRDLCEITTQYPGDGVGSVPCDDRDDSNWDD